MNPSDPCLPDDAASIQSTGYLLWHASRRWRRELAAALAPLELTYAEWGLLASLHFLAPPGAARKPGHGPTQKEVADHAGLDPMVTSEALRALERRDLVQRVSSSRDQRARALVITQEGARLALVGVAIVREIAQRLFANISDLRAFECALNSVIEDSDESASF